MKYKILTEASGSLTTGYLIKAIQSAGHLAVASDIDDDIAGRYIAEDFILMPRVRDPELWNKTLDLLENNQINIVIPSLDETLLGWAERKNELKQKNIHIILSDPETVHVCTDKWMTYLFFKEAGIPTPESSLEQTYSLVKPRMGRGAVGVLVDPGPVSMEGMISQELLSGVEYTVDVFCDRHSQPIYIVPRKRLKVREGKSTGGIVVDHPLIFEWVRRICQSLRFCGPINIQCFECPDGSIKFLEINPRIAGGMALGFAATENWISLIIDTFIKEKELVPKDIQYGMKMMRFYDEIFIP
ncbi:ATP-grasp domain-containing protein [Paenibacillus thalictri]|uniref:ATP-grasp domain-containing protein n=1 Tax=Paenibacillus thalictri TaxID=2527873 RepID=A0A4Q9DIE6_9BACL|nr:ATP-grasp domain-containing protein [Paenibacillus thalictri]TBL73004.1 ATP-grasp domain-containing protein [Paenibacillus thalictri]